MMVSSYVCLLWRIAGVKDLCVIRSIQYANRLAVIDYGGLEQTHYKKS